MAVSVGKGQERFTHESCRNRVTYAFLPRKELAPQGKPRGVASLKHVICKRIKKGSFLVFDGWSASLTAARQLGYRCAPPVKHDHGWRDRKTGFHSNGIEGENSKLKSWLRARYSNLILSPAELTTDVATEEAITEQDSFDMMEYCFYVNVGSDMHTVMAALAAVSGGPTKPDCLK